MQRVRTSLPDFVKAGWEVTVLTVDDPTPTAPLEPELNNTVPESVNVARAHCFSRKWTAKFGLNNVALRSLPFLFFRGCRLLNATRYDAVYFSTTMFIVMPFGRIWKALYGVPYVIDLQDPWVSDYYERPDAPRPPGGWKYRVAHGLALMLEGWSLRKVSHLIVVSRTYGDFLKKRYADLAHLPVTEIPFGSAEPDIQFVRENLPHRAAILPAGSLRVVFAGALGPGMMTSVNLFFAAIAEARRQGLPVSAHFFGTSYSAANEAKNATGVFAERHHVHDFVHESPARLRYLDALQVTLEADVNLVLGSTDLAFTPSKIANVVAAQRPILAIAPVGSATIERLKEFGEAYVVFSDHESPARSIAHIVEIMRAAHTKTPAIKKTPNVSTGTSELAARQIRILESVFGAN